MFLLLSLVIIPIAVKAQDLEIIGSCEVPGYARHLDISGNYAYLSGSDINLQIVDISDPNNPFHISSYDTTSGSEDVDVSGDYAFLTYWTGLLSIDVSDPTNPALAGAYESSRETYSHNVFVDKGIAYLAKCSDNLKIIDVSDPLNPILIGSYDSLYWHEAYGIYVYGSYAYLTEFFRGLYIIDISNPSAPFLAGYYDAAPLVYDVSVSGNYAFVTDGTWNESSISIIDASNPSDPFRIASYSFSPHTSVKAIYSTTEFVFLAHGDLTILDISNPSQPTVAGILEAPPYCQDVFVRGDLIFITSNHTFTILRFLHTNTEEGIQYDKMTLSLPQNYPNPFNASTTISYSLPEQDEVTISIHNILGQKVATIFDGMHEAGEHTITWDAGEFPSGVYFARLEAGTHSENIKMVLLK
jgi:hypothetical protein